MVDGYQREALSTPLQIPLIYGVDAVHGHNNVVGATLFPHNIGLGATRDPALVERVGQVTANEVRATGIPWTFAPCLCVTRDERWGRSYESFGEDPALVTSLAGVAITGLQGTDPSDLSGPDKVLATAKHWVGDGGTRYGRHWPVRAIPSTRASPTSPTRTISTGSLSTPTYRRSRPASDRSCRRTRRSRSVTVRWSGCTRTPH